jgi:hypothetical protein
MAMMIGRSLPAPLSGGRIVDVLGLQLSVDVPLEANLLEAFEVARVRAIAEPIEQMDDLLLFGERGADLRVSHARWHPFKPHRCS